MASASVSSRPAGSQAFGRIGGQPFEAQLIAKWIRGSRMRPRRMRCSMSSRLRVLPPATCLSRWKNRPSRTFQTERIGYSSITAASTKAL